MKRFVVGEARGQSTLFPAYLDDFIADDNPVRAVEAFVEGLNLRALGFDGVDPHATGRPAYHPATLLKIYIYGYLNRIQSSRRLERETQRNVELMWLAERLSPDFKTIADFRRDNGKAIRGVCREFVLLCRRLNLFSQALVVIDGSKFKAVNNRDRNFTAAKMKRRMEQIEQSIERYLGQLDYADRDEPSVAEAKTTRLKEKIARLKEEAQRLAAIEVQRRQASDEQISLTDPDARSMATSGRGTGMVGYNVQTAVDSEHHLIVAHEVTNIGNDRGQLARMATQAKEALTAEELTVVADRGYFKGEEILACETDGITTYLPKPQTSGNQAKGLFPRHAFRYRSEDDEYECPAGERLRWRFTTVEKGQTLHCYWSSACPGCSLRPRCTGGQQRRIKRWEHEAVLEAVQARLERRPEVMRIRRQTVEHPFGTLKSWMGSTHFLTKTLEHVSTEMSLHVLAYNLKRVVNILGCRPLAEAMQI
ncbi:IS1182 family transposase [Sediminicurvatus halobius]|uniref:IS1182 family transposase n=1 Tax=Sediminicurvatus halobius TaxID=2182432 RepID=A0A2U2MVN7_9GAMM|nr:IS1182 family transposase [Spiribacter halobius]PWG60904.1 IS1182 family transposase [Spiribacter halobius]UEX76763.1 IS1182 family transposase [Spiribacter halobius]UEX76932.1 IS1182 family transposase [Spiribacter halobius]UEX78021.1 IS1182 family transposase [Spiribacter halobius]